MKQLLQRTCALFLGQLDVDHILRVVKGYGFRLIGCACVRRSKCDAHLNAYGAVVVDENSRFSCNVIFTDAEFNLCFVISFCRF